MAQPLLHHILRRGDLKVFVVIGRHTFSAAQNTATLLDRHTDAVFVGEPSGSRPNFVGETAPFVLPCSGVRANVSDVYWQTSWPYGDRPGHLRPAHVRGAQRRPGPRHGRDPRTSGRQDALMKSAARSATM